MKENAAGDVSGTESPSSCVDPETQMKHFKRQKQFHNPGITETPPGLPWWQSGWESTRQRGGHGLDPWSVKTPHATSTEPSTPESKAVATKPMCCNC